MKTRTVKNFTKSTILTLLILFVLYSIAGTFSYLTFGINVAPDIMMMYDTNQPMILFGTISLVIKMITTYPLMLFCGRDALIGLYNLIIMNTAKILKFIYFLSKLYRFIRRIYEIKYRSNYERRDEKKNYNNNILVFNHIIISNLYA